MADNGYSSTIRRLGIPDYFVEHGTQEELIRECGFDTDSVVKTIREMVKGAGQRAQGAW
jgi:1-deoxy-D-xylulose-5-phosphate synthase